MPGIEPGAPGLSPKTLRPPLLWRRINDQLRPIEIGVTNRIRTGTNAFTGRDAAVTSWPPSKWCPHVDSHHEPPPSQRGMHILLHLGGHGIRDRTRTD